MADRVGRRRLLEMAGCDDPEDWALRLAGAWRALLRLQLSAEAVLVLDCSAMAQKHGKSALAALCAATRAAEELSLAKVVWVAPKRLIASAAVWQPASCSAERLASARVAVVPSEGMRDVLRASLQEHTQGAVAVAACEVRCQRVRCGSSSEARGSGVVVKWRSG